VAANGEEFVCQGIAASARAGCGPAAITVQIGHGGHRVATATPSYHGRGDHHASEVKTESDGGRPSHEIEVSEFVLQGVSDEAADADQNLVRRRLGDGNSHRFERQPSSVRDVTDAENFSGIV